MVRPGSELYGLEIADITRLKSGTLYPALARLRAHGLLESTEEEIDPSQVKRPPRIYYRLTKNGLPVAREALNAVREDESARRRWAKGAISPA
jgi:DNA-binding PadR family transcriptional regulator